MAGINDFLDWRRPQSSTHTEREIYEAVPEDLIRRIGNLETQVNQLAMDAEIKLQTVLQQLADNNQMIAFIMEHGRSIKDEPLKAAG